MTPEKHFKEVADSLHEFYYGQGTIHNHGVEFGRFNQMIERLCTTFKKANATFDRRLFLERIYRG